MACGLYIKTVRDIKIFATWPWKSARVARAMERKCTSPFLKFTNDDVKCSCTAVLFIQKEHK